MTPFRAVSGSGTDWMMACDACIEALREHPSNATLGFIYASDPFAHALDLITERLKVATEIKLWVGTGGNGVCTTGQGAFEQAAIVILAATFPAQAFQVVDGIRANSNGRQRFAINGHPAKFGIVHGDPRQVKTSHMIDKLSRESGAFLVGGLTSAVGNGALQIAGQPTEGGLSGVLISDEVPMITGLSQGCTPIGPVREITGIDGPWIDTLDHEPALECLKDDVGPLLAKNPERMAGFILAARPLTSGDGDDYLVRELAEIDPIRRLIMVADDLRRGDRLCFVKRDPEAAKSDLKRLASSLRERAGDRPLLGALYHSCLARGQHMFGSDSKELAIIEEELGQVPLAGFFTNGEIFRNKLHGYSGVLTLFLG